SDELLQMIRGSESEDLQKEQQKLFNEFMAGSLGEKLALAADLAEKETADLKNTMDHWLHNLQKKLRENPDINLLNKIKAIMRAQRLLEQNVNSKLLLSELMVNAN
ncbi:MAG TPA: hypothetical protein VEC17_01690, partial [Candidatus Binatia bacterium]|nr:hypothetical protein [Candidatus Binatia bacterium]